MATFTLLSYLLYSTLSLHSDLINICANMSSALCFRHVKFVLFKMKLDKSNVSFS